MGGTDLTLDPFLWVGRAEELLVQWDADLNSDEREVLAKLTELLPYLGRAESQCEARLLDTDPVPDETRGALRPKAPRETRLLAPARPVSRAALEMSLVDMRRDLGAWSLPWQHLGQLRRWQASRRAGRRAAGFPCGGAPFRDRVPSADEIGQRHIARRQGA